MTEITVENFTQAMRDAVAERGEDYVYNQLAGGACVYSDTHGAPSCLIGVALSKIDPALVPGYNFFGGADYVLHELGAPREVQVAALAAQKEQDGGFTWGHALLAYEAVLNR